MADDLTNLALWGPKWHRNIGIAMNHVNNNMACLQPSPNFKDKQFQNAFVILNALLRLAIGLLEMVSNGFILYITWKYSRCKHLINF